MASVSVVSTNDFRANLLQQQNAVQESEAPFSSLLNSVADVKVSAHRPDAPQVPERNNPPAKQSKPEADADRNAKRQTKDATKPEAKAKPDASAGANANAPDEDADNTDNETKDATAADALLMIALGDSQEQAPAQTPDVANAVAQATTAQPETSSQPVPTPAAVAAPVAQAETQSQSAAVAATAPTATPSNEIKPINVKADAEVALPKSVAETLSSLAKPIKSASSLETQVQTQPHSQQPGAQQTSATATLQGPAHLEMLNAAISKHAQLALGLEGGDAAPEAQKPIISSNAVAPNFALTAQVNTPVQVQTQQVAEASRAVPVDQLGLEIATRASKGERRFDIRLDPPELGRIDVRLEIDSKGNTTTKLIVERTETLDMLQRDARGLEKALQNAGLKTDAGGLQFSLQQDAQTQQQMQQQNYTPDIQTRPDTLRADSEIMTEVSVNNASLAAQLRGGIDIRI